MYLETSGINQVHVIQIRLLQSQQLEELIILLMLETYVCDMIHIVYGDFDEYDPVQNYKKYKITYFAKAEQDGSDNYFLYTKTKESWLKMIQALKHKSAIGQSEKKIVLNVIMM